MKLDWTHNINGLTIVGPGRGESALRGRKLSTKQHKLIV